MRHSFSPPLDSKEIRRSACLGTLLPEDRRERREDEYQTKNGNLGAGTVPLLIHPVAPRDFVVIPDGLLLRSQLPPSHRPTDLESVIALINRRERDVWAWLYEQTASGLTPLRSGSSGGRPDSAFRLLIW